MSVWHVYLTHCGAPAKPSLPLFYKNCTVPSLSRPFLACGEKRGQKGGKGRAGEGGEQGGEERTGEREGEEGRRGKSQKGVKECGAGGFFIMGSLSRPPQIGSAAEEDRASGQVREPNHSL